MPDPEPAPPLDTRPPPPPPEEGRLARLRRAPATSALLVLLVLIFLGSAAEPGLVVRFAKVNERIREGELWRLVTAGFLHGGLVHVAVNGFALATIGPTVEQLYGGARLLLVFLVASATGFLASFLLVEATSLGASAGLFGLLGVLLGFAVRERLRLPPRTRRGMIQEILTVAALNLGLGLAFPFVDNAAHVGGFLGGLALGFVLRARPVF